MGLWDSLSKQTNMKLLLLEFIRVNIQVKVSIMSPKIPKMSPFQFKWIVQLYVMKGIFVCMCHKIFQLNMKVNLHTLLK